MDVKTRQGYERQIVRAIVKSAIDLGYSVSLHDGEEWPVRGARVAAKVMSAVMGVDEERLHFYDATGQRVGSVFLVYGNSGYDVICDYTANATIERILAPADVLANKIEARHG